MPVLTRLFYIDGVADTHPFTARRILAAANCTYHIGGKEQWYQLRQQFKWQFDEVRVWNNVVLSNRDKRDWMCRKIISSRTHSMQILKATSRLDEGSGINRRFFNTYFGSFENLAPFLQTSGVLPWCGNTGFCEHYKNSQYKSYQRRKFFSNIHGCSFRHCCIPCGWATNTLKQGKRWGER